MNVKQVFAALAIAMVGSVAMAAEATQFDPAPATLARATVKAELAQSRVAEGLVVHGEATQFVDRPATDSPARAEVRAQARAFARTHAFNALYVGA